MLLPLKKKIWLEQNDFSDTTAQGVKAENTARQEILPSPSVALMNGRITLHLHL